MKFVSIFSMSILTLSIWGLFFTLFFVELDPIYQAQPNVDEQRELGAEVSGKLSRFEQVEQDEEASRLEAEQDETEQLETVSNTNTEEEPPSSLVERASSPYNDILYEFEKDSPVSVDALLGALDLN
ncbi:hypothetical protein [Amphibacillus jilinensis]|uniref:hypothetical protein n=1 Tax=Amphibacillus jilinensis TaxID=1216008 RepID=UPI0002D60170|nr:hypothetical protein [Amphibacillus jilinensis]